MSSLVRYLDDAASAVLDTAASAVKNITPASAIDVSGDALNAGVDFTKLLDDGVSTTVIKNTVDDVAAAVVKNADTTSAIKVTAANADESVAEVGKQLAKTEMKRTVPQTVKEAMSEAWAFAKKHPGFTVGTMAATTVAALAYARFKSRQGTTADIVKVVAEPSSAGYSKVRIFLSKSLDALVTDKIDIAGSASVPSVDGRMIPIVKVVSGTELVVTGPALTTPGGPGGTVTLQTSFENQVLGVMAESGSAVVETVVEAAADAAQPLFDAVPALPGLEWLGEYGVYAAYAVFAVGVLIVMRSVSKIAKHGLI